MIVDFGKTGSFISVINVKLGTLHTVICAFRLSPPFCYLDLHISTLSR